MVGLRENQREDQIVSADARLEQHRDLLNQWMLRLPLKERQRRWGEYAARICQLEKDLLGS
jgi:hypothetical protein